MKMKNNLKDNFGNIWTVQKGDIKEDDYAFNHDTGNVIAVEPDDNGEVDLYFYNETHTKVKPMIGQYSKAINKDLALITSIIISEDILGGTVFQTFDKAYAIAKDFQKKYAHDFNWEEQELDFDETIILLFYCIN
jgi:hypothetical protein